MNTRRYSTGRNALAAVSLLLVVLTSAIRAGASTGAPPVLENLTVSQVGITTATVGGVVDPNGTDTSAWFQYGVLPGPPYASSTPVQDIGELRTSAWCDRREQRPVGLPGVEQRTNAIVAK